MPYSKAKTKEYNKKYRELNREKLDKNKKEWALNNKERSRKTKRAWYLKARKKWSKKKKKELVLRANYARLRRKEILACRPRPELCEVCLKTSTNGKGLHFDHCHKMGKFRGWLCDSCNLSLGRLKDNSDTLRKLAVYIDTFNIQGTP